MCSCLHQGSFQVLQRSRVARRLEMSMGGWRTFRICTYSGQTSSPSWISLFFVTWPIKSSAEISRQQPVCQILRVQVFQLSTSSDVCHWPIMFQAAELCLQIQPDRLPLLSTVSGPLIYFSSSAQPLPSYRSMVQPIRVCGKHTLQRWSENSHGAQHQRTVGFFWRAFVDELYGKHATLCRAWLE